MTVIESSSYETDTLLNQYLLFHYGADQDLMPFSFGPKNALHFPIRCVTECLDFQALSPQAKALDLGCAVGRSSFELSKHCQQVVAIDNSKRFISAAKQIQQKGSYEYMVNEEGRKQTSRQAKLPDDVFPERVEFRCQSAMEIANESLRFEVVLAANLICRLADPQAFLSLLPRVVAPQGQLIIATPYSWLEKFTPQKLWLSSLNEIKKILEPHFALQRAFDLPFIIRDHLRKYEWNVSQMSIWKRSSSPTSF